MGYRGCTISKTHNCMSSEWQGTMNLKKAIQDLYAEREIIERAITAIEEWQRIAAMIPILPSGRSRRGRKSMGAEERQEVSERMKKYWASRRA